MSLDYAVDRLYETGWLPAGAALDRLADGRLYPSVAAVQEEFARAGLDLCLKENLIFNCCRATWGPTGSSPDRDHPPDERHGTVIGTSAVEAAVFALAHLRSALAEHHMAEY